MTALSLKSLAGAAALAVATFAALPAQAAIAVYTNLGNFQSAAAPTVLENFNGPLNAGLTITGSHVNLSGNRLNDQINDGVGVTSTLFSFAAPILAFGGSFDLAGPGGQGTGIIVTLDLVGGGQTVLAQQIPRSTNGFWGFISTEAFSAVRFSMGTQSGSAETYTLDNLRYAAAPVPTPAALGLFGMGLIGLGLARRKA